MKNKITATILFLILIGFNISCNDNHANSSPLPIVDLKFNTFDKELKIERDENGVYFLEKDDVSIMIVGGDLSTHDIAPNEIKFWVKQEPNNHFMDTAYKLENLTLLKHTRLRRSPNGDIQGWMYGYYYKINNIPIHVDFSFNTDKANLELYEKIIPTIQIVTN